MSETRTIEAEALSEIEAEDRRAAVETMKAIIRERRARPWWRRLIPFTITIAWRE